jgi:tRNA1Val (adenine37-N6)-methyltransferase
MGSIFRFKQFSVDQSGCAMKINTDGVLIGGIVTADAPSRILDVGTGTGVIAMMLAQRFPAAQVESVEIDASAALTAAKNFASSPFADRLAVHSGNILSFDSELGYDLIISNPPFFVNDLKNPEARKRLARHADKDFFVGLIRKVASLLNPAGECWLILPLKQAEELVVQAVLYKLFPRRIIHVHSDESKPEIRQVICFSFANVAAVHEDFYIYAAQGVYTEAYVSLLKDFFLAF